MIPFNRPGRVGNELQYLSEAVEQGQLSGDGRFTKQCQTLIEKLANSPKALLTHSCTAALEMAAILCELQPGDEVIMPSYTFVSTANAVVLRGAVPVFVDIDPITLNIDPAQVAEAMGPKTRAIFAVHYAGFSADMDALIEIAHSNDNVMVVEDAAQALGSTYKSRPCGSLGDMATFSFHETKNIVSGEGGALTINHPALIERAEVIREKGTNRTQFFRGQVDKYTWKDLGSSFLPGELIASYLYAQLENAELVRQRRLAIFDQYMMAFQDLQNQGVVRLPQWSQDCVGNGHMFYFLMQNMDSRTDFINYMRSKGIGTPFHYVPLHSAPAGQRFARTHGLMNNTVRTSETLVRLPMFFDLGSDTEKIIETVYGYFDTRTGEQP